tara:strand:- start:389 stop:973 length:585 start_codon:yes stop_codon:yes gene_type:complete
MLKFFIILFLFFSCTPTKENITNLVDINKDEIIETKKYFPFYLIGEEYLIDNTLYIPNENYDYVEDGIASMYQKRDHGKMTSNNEIIDITIPTAAHKTLPLPSVIKITNLENGIYIILRVNDRGPNNNSEMIKVTMKAAKLLGFYYTKTAKVKVEILENESKQLKLVAQSINEEISLETISAAPTDQVKINNID